MNIKLRFLQNPLALSAITLIVIVWSTVSFLAYQNNQFKEYSDGYKRGIDIFKTTPAPSPVPTIYQLQITEDNNWYVFKNEEYHYTISYPKNFRLIGRDPASIEIDLDQTEGAPTRWLRINVVSPENISQYQILNNLEVGETTVDKANEFNTWKRLNNRDIANVSAKVFINEKPWELPILKLIILEHNNVFLIIKYVPYNSTQESIKKQPDDPEARIDFVGIFDQILSTFRFDSELQHSNLPAE